MFTSCLPVKAITDKTTGPDQDIEKNIADLKQEIDYGIKIHKATFSCQENYKIRHNEYKT